MKIIDICAGRDVVNVEGVVGNVWNIRDSKAATSGISSSSCNNNNSSTSEDAGDLALFTDDGPLAKESQKVFSLSMYSFRGDSSQRRENSAEVMLYFYGIWAEKCAFFSPGDLLTISGPASMVHAAQMEDKDDFPHCLVFGGAAAGGAVQLRVESKNINTNSRQCTFTSQTVRTAPAPPLIDWEAIKKKNRQLQQQLQKNTNLPPRQHPPASAAAVVPAAAATESNKSSSGRQRSSHPSTSTSTTPLPSLAYTYTPISDLRGTALIGKLVNIYGVIHTYQQPKSTKGSHKYSCSFTLIDPSCTLAPPPPPPSPHPAGGADTASVSPASVQSVVLVFFANSLASLPPVKRVGDILRLHRVKVAYFQKNPQVLGWEKRSSFLHFHRRAAAPSPPPSLSATAAAAAVEEEGGDLDQLVQQVRLAWELTSSSDKYSFNEATAAAVNALQKFILSAFPTPSLSFARINKDSSDTSDYRVRLNALGGRGVAAPAGPSSLSSSSTGPSSGRPLDPANMDAVVLVVNIRGEAVVTEGQLPSVLHLLVWDGSGGGGSITTPEAAGKSDMIVDAATVRVATQAVKSVQAILPPSSSSFPPLLLLAGGYAVLTVVLAEAPQQLRVAATLTPGTWIRVQHLSSHLVTSSSSSSSSAHNIIGEKSAVNVLPPFCSDVKDLVRAYLHTTLPQCLRRQPALHTPSASPPPVLGKRRMHSSSGQAFTPLALCLASPSPASFVVLVRLRSFHPASLRNIVMVHRAASAPASVTPRRGHAPSPVSSGGGDTGTLVETQTQTQTQTEKQTEEQEQGEGEGGDTDTLVDEAHTSTAALSSPAPVTACTYTYTYMFSVCIFDDTACCDAIVYAKDGEQLLAGVTAEQLYHDPSLQQACQDKLARAIAEGVTFELNLMTYLTTNQPSSSAPGMDAAMAAGGGGGGGSSRRVRVANKNTTVTSGDQNLLEEQDSNRGLIKRVRIVNSSLFRQNDDL